MEVSRTKIDVRLVLSKVKDKRDDRDAVEDEIGCAPTSDQTDVAADFEGEVEGNAHQKGHAVAQMDVDLVRSLWVLTLAHRLRRPSLPDLSWSNPDYPPKRKDRQRLSRSSENQKERG